MKVLLLKDVKKLGKEGDTVEVKNGYGRNFLVASGVALEANSASLKRVEEMKKKRIKMMADAKKHFGEIKDKLAGVSLTISSQVKDETEEIYGTIGEAQIIKGLKEEGIELNKGSIVLEEPIKKLGVYNLKVKLHPEVEGALRVWVVKK